MFGRLFEGWHLVLLLIVVLVLFGGKRLPDAARGLGRSLRIFKSEVKEMQEDDKRRPASPSAPSAPEPIEGRVVEGEAGRATSPSEQHRDI
jgi:sec-independent protein translocase protein TatA